MTTADEVFDVVDDQDRVIGRAPRAEVHARGLKHRAVHVLLLNSRGELLIQKRSAAKDTFPGCYDSSASGHVASGEDYDASAVRELDEELGIQAPQTALRKCFKIPACVETGWEFVWVYTVQGDHRPTINVVELDSADFWALTNVRESLKRQPDLWAPVFARVFRETEKRGALPQPG